MLLFYIKCLLNSILRSNSGVIKYILTDKYYQKKTVKYHRTIKRDEIYLYVFFAFSEAHGAEFLDFVTRK